MNLGTTQRLLRGVSRRQRLADLGRRYHAAFLTVCVLGAAVLTGSRLLGLLPPVISLGTLALAPLAAILAALALHRAPPPTRAARAIDASCGSKDLFLTAVDIGHSLGAYQPVVLEQADARAADVQPRRVAPFRWRRRAASEAASVACLAVAVLTLPQMDPFGRQAVRDQANRREQRLRELAQATEARARLLNEPQAPKPGERVREKLDALMRTLAEVRPQDKAGNLSRLADQQKHLGEMWRNAGRDLAVSQASKTASAQQFGMADPASAAAWRRQLQAGDVSGVKRELQALKELAAALAAAPGGPKGDALRSELMNRLQALQQALAEQPGAAALSSALQRALEQLQMCNQPGCAAGACKGLQATLALSDAELGELTERLQNLQSIEEALKAIQMAKRLNEAGKLDGSECGSCNSIADYASLYAAKLAGMGQGGQGSPAFGPADQGGGIGAGPRPAGSDAAQTAYKPEQSRSPLQAGQMLLSWKTREVSDPGCVQEDYARALQRVRQEASEAIAADNIPAGYQGPIRAYFDTLDAAAPATGAREPR